jgi:hypothetical protein
MKKTIENPVSTERISARAEAYSVEEKALVHPLLLVVCLGDDGGLFHVNVNKQKVTAKVFYGDCRGIVKDKDTYILTVEPYGLIRLDSNFNIIQRKQFAPDLDLHGLCIGDEEGVLLVCETMKDRLGIYDSTTFAEISKVTPFPGKVEKKDRHHINDILWLNGQVFVSMFSLKGGWRAGIYDDGAIVSIDIHNGLVDHVLLPGLKQPHSFFFVDNEIYFCNSMDCQVRKGDEVILQFNGYTRGLARCNEFLYIGQSENRKLDLNQHRFSHIAMDCGIHIWDSINKTSRFLPVAAQGVVDITTALPHKECGKTNGI